MDRQRRILAGVFLALLVPAATLGTLAGLKWGVGTWWGQGIYGFCKIWLLAVPTIWLFGVERGRVSGSPMKQGGLVVGLILGVVVAGAIAGGYGFASEQGWADGGQLKKLAAGNRLDQLPIYLTFAIWTSTVNALLEEYVWRWFVVRRWEEILGPAAGGRMGAAILAGICFTVHHVAVLGLYFDVRGVVLGGFGVFIGGVIWSALYVRYRSIWPGFACHVLADISIFCVGWRLIGG